ncbi:hypothetical protein HaLaN_08069 [Haematococcus lacustris]|uniref:ENT domain-containing protein n=1 Tax=Haematococcus lacustris TaxID=44745 RepID=A0A699ZA29_HAELA|nr:hypothetical protein HaLaN_08069 [Haematococcus lacustris]
MSLSPQEVTQQRQALNDEAYFAVLKALLAANNGQLLLTRKLRRELGISDEQHKVWHDELRAAMQAGAIQYWCVPAQLVSTWSGLASHQSVAVFVLSTLDRTRTVGHTQQGRASITGLDQQPAPVVDRSMVGYKANVVTSTTGQWQEGLITDFVDNHIMEHPKCWRCQWGTFGPSPGSCQLCAASTVALVQLRYQTCSAAAKGTGQGTAAQ